MLYGYGDGGDDGDYDVLKAIMQLRVFGTAKRKCWLQLLLLSRSWRSGARVCGSSRCLAVSEIVLRFGENEQGGPFCSVGFLPLYFFGWHRGCFASWVVT